MRVSWKEIGQAILFILGCQLAGILGTATTTTGGSVWYLSLNKPAFTPPDWVFGSVWSVLYTLMGIAAFIIWRKGWQRQDVRAALGVFLGQLGLNAVWMPVFFGAHRVLAALLILALLWIMIVVTIRRFWLLSPVAGWLLVPYLIWVTYATLLSSAIWLLN